MAKFEVLIKATVSRYGVVEIEADTMSAAKAAAREMSIKELDTQEAFLFSSGEQTNITAPKARLIQ